MMNWEASFSILTHPGVMAYIGKGVAFTLVLSALSVVISILLGSVLALCRNYCTGKSRIFGWIATAYIGCSGIRRCYCGFLSAWWSAPAPSSSPTKCWALPAWR